MDNETGKVVLIALIMILSWIPILSVGKAGEMIRRATYRKHKHNK